MKQYKEQPYFSHVSYVTDYMEIALDIASKHFDSVKGKSVLDLPAGNGWVGDQLSKKGANVVSADINEDRPDFAKVTMEKPLPFTEEQFDIIISAEGIEHVFSPFALFSEFARCLKPGGILIVTTPNVQNLFSRYKFLCTGYLFQFSPFDKVPFDADILRDKGHISPLFYSQFRYYAEHFGMKTQKPLGGRMKRKVLIALLFPFILVGRWWSYRDWIKTSGDPTRKEIISHLFSLRVLLSRSIVLIATK